MAQLNATVTSAPYPMKKGRLQWYARRMFPTAFSPHVLKLAKWLCLVVLAIVAVALVGSIRMMSLSPLVYGFLAGGTLLAVLLVWHELDIGDVGMTDDLFKVTVPIDGVFKVTVPALAHRLGRVIQVFTGAWNWRNHLNTRVLHTLYMCIHTANQRKNMLLATRADADTAASTRSTCATNMGQQLGNSSINVFDAITTSKADSRQATASLTWLHSLVPAQSIARPPCMAALAIGVF